MYTSSNVPTNHTIQASQIILRVDYMDIIMGLTQIAIHSKRRPAKPMFIQDFSNPKETIAAEKQIKGWSRKKKEVLFQAIGIKSMS